MQAGGGRRQLISRIPSVPQRSRDPWGSTTFFGRNSWLSTGIPSIDTLHRRANSRYRSVRRDFVKPRAPPVKKQRLSCKRKRRVPVPVPNLPRVPVPTPVPPPCMEGLRRSSMTSVQNNNVCSGCLAARTFIMAASTDASAAAAAATPGGKQQVLKDQFQQTTPVKHRRKPVIDVDRPSSGDCTCDWSSQYALSSLPSPRKYHTFEDLTVGHQGSYLQRTPQKSRYRSKSKGIVDLQGAFEAMLREYQQRCLFLKALQLQTSPQEQTSPAPPSQLPSFSPSSSPSLPMSSLSPLPKQCASSGCLVSLDQPSPILESQASVQQSCLSGEKRTPLNCRTVLGGRTRSRPTHSLDPAFRRKVVLDARALLKHPKKSTSHGSLSSAEQLRRVDAPSSTRCVAAALPAGLSTRFPAGPLAALTAELPPWLPKVLPTGIPTALTTGLSTELPTQLVPTKLPTELVPTKLPTELVPTEVLTELPTELLPTKIPTEIPTEIVPRKLPTELVPTELPTELVPTKVLTELPTELLPTKIPTELPTELVPTKLPAELPAVLPAGSSTDLSNAENKNKNVNGPVAGSDTPQSWTAEGSSSESQPCEIPSGDIIRALTFHSVVFNHSDRDPSEEIVYQDLTSSLTIKRVEAALTHFVPVRNAYGYGYGPLEGIADLRELPTSTMSKRTSVQTYLPTMFELRREISLEMLGNNGRPFSEAMATTTAAAAESFGPTSVSVPLQRQDETTGPATVQSDGVPIAPPPSESPQVIPTEQVEINDRAEAGDFFPSPREQCPPQAPSTHQVRPQSNNRANRTRDHDYGNINTRRKTSNVNFVTNLSRTGRIFLACCLAPSVFTFSALLFQISCDCA